MENNIYIKMNKVTNGLLLIIFILLLIIIFKKQPPDSKVIGLQHSIDSIKNVNVTLRDSLKVSKPIIIKKEIDIANILKSINKIDLKINNINEQLKEDTNNTYNLSSDSITQWLLAR